MINGILNVYKEKGFTSHDVVAKLRGILRQKKIGHTGTLDPDAEGVLPVCLGKATKLCDTMEYTDKAYRATLLLGCETDTEDITGKVLKESEVTCTEEEVVTVIQKFVGNLMQIPPMYSAIKVNGKKLYELAREGKVIERKPRPVTVYDIQILDIALPEVVIEVKCSKGTYIRSLCRDIGEELGCGGCMKALVRTEACGFSLDTALTLSEVEDKRDDGTLLDVITPIDFAFSHYPAMTISNAYDKYLLNGNVIPVSVPFSEEKIRIYNEENRFIGLYLNQKDSLKPFKLFFDL